MRSLFFILTIAVTACATQMTTASSEEELVLLRDVLTEYQALNTRLEKIAAPLLLANAELCPRTSRDIGITVHTLANYPEELRDAARNLMDVTDALSIRSVRTGSTADKAGLQTGDNILQIGPHIFEARARPQAYYASVSSKALNSSKANITIKRAGTLMTVTLAPETICGYPVDVFFNDTLNGHTDGDRVFITSELLRQVPDDVNLALIISHELAHAIAGHVDQAPSKALELEADKMALTLMARAGYDIEKAVAYWQYAPHPSTEASGAHPSTQERYDNFIRTKTDIQTKQKTGLALTFSP